MPCRLNDQNVGPQKKSPEAGKGFGAGGEVEASGGSCLWGDRCASGVEIHSTRVLISTSRRRGLRRPRE